MFVYRQTQNSYHSAIFCAKLLNKDVHMWFLNLLKQLIAPITDRDWDIDGAKLAGVLTVALGIAVLVACLIRWDFGPGPFGLSLVGSGGALLGWRAHTDR